MASSRSDHGARKLRLVHLTSRYTPAKSPWKSVTTDFHGDFCCLRTQRVGVSPRCQRMEGSRIEELQDSSVAAGPTISATASLSNPTLREILEDREPRT